MKIIKLVKSKSPQKNKKSAGNKNTSIIQDVYAALGLILLLFDDILFFALISYAYGVYNGPTGYGCLICLLQITQCTKDSQYNSILSTIQNLLLLVLIKTLLLIVKKLILGFFNWTKTGTIFDIVFLRLLATVMFTILSIVIVYTPGLYVLKIGYFSLYSPSGTLGPIVSSLSNIGLMMWGGILLIATCYPVMLLFTS
ncbi:hypothetical protein HZS_7873 [Henneguya salminicola]|nr:hypothetical protein HZS_7873 [Henneguya salminicola]